MESENKSGLPEPLPDEENSEVNGGICEIKEGDHDGYDDDIPPDEKAQLLMLLVRVPLLLLAVWLILQIFPILFIPNESGISNKPGESCGAICFFSDTFYGFAVPVVKCIALLILGAVLIPIFLWCVTGNKDILLIVLLVGILILPLIVIFMLLVFL
ncbi:hypothetical protein SAMN02910344_01850 [Ruminobacter amylophilus]|uniref:Uncharacterized protein n=1 Tax=Ruminobacter amylophilus TaxID=867 RepID=A0A662ZJ04_9GAMM|nr:hypothetical protein [Ruminobacter amylophilus]SFP60606.1 hypothetical protein SAMN02910344_01850 [Ruminobacter amylophilus]